MAAPSGSDVDVVVVGDLMIDVAVESRALRRGGDVHGRVHVRPGGAGANAAVWAASRGARVRLHGRVGDDVGGSVIAGAIRDRGVEPALALDAEAMTGAVLVVHEGNERSMVADRGANARIRPPDLPDALRAGAVLISGYLLFDQGSEEAARAALDRADAPTVAVDAASWPLVERFGSERFVEATARADLLLANDREAEALTGHRGVDAARALASSYRRACVKLGRGGAVLAEGDDVTTAEVDPVEADDPTGAGDAFAGVLLAALARGARVEDALREAADAATLAVASGEAWPER